MRAKCIESIIVVVFSLLASGVVMVLPSGFSTRDRISTSNCE
jgi:hypothetical protein